MPAPQPTPSIVDRLALWLGGIEQVGTRALPVEEFAHPWPLLAMALLGVNDHVLKGSSWVPGWLTGKLSDFAGLFFFPLFVTAALDTVLYVGGRLAGGRGPDWSLRRFKLLFALGFTALLFVPLKLSDAWGTLYIRAMHALDVLDLFGNFAVTRDPTDLVALVMFPLVYLHGRRFVRRVPVGRLGWLAARARRAPDAVDRVLAEGMKDVRTLSAGHPGAPAALDRFLTAFAETVSRPTDAKRQQRAQQRLQEFRAALEGAA